MNETAAPSNEETNKNGSSDLEKNTTFETLLEVHNISLSFGGVHALDEVSFDIRKGEIRAIIGPNGAGKSSMLNVINGFYHPQKGSITYKGNERKKNEPTGGCVSRNSEDFSKYSSISRYDYTR